MTEPRTFSDNLALGISRLAVAGLSPMGPGTCGSLVAMIVWLWRGEAWTGLIIGCSILLSLGAAGAGGEQCEAQG